jgi:hypothetical protein
MMHGRESQSCDHHVICRPICHAYEPKLFAVKVMIETTEKLVQRLGKLKYTSNDSYYDSEGSDVFHMFNIINVVFVCLFCLVIMYLKHKENELAN